MAFIKSCSIHAPVDVSEAVLQLPSMENDWLEVIKRNYKQYIDPKQGRRMSRMLKIGVSAGLEALEKAGIKNPDGIIVGTGLGCIDDTDKFLTSIINDNEQTLSPTPFIRSTHNTVAGQLALFLQSHNYNFTYAHRHFSFEWALIDAMMFLQENSDPKNYLVGGIDEMNRPQFDILSSLGILKPCDETQRDIIGQKDNRVVGGAGAGFYVLGNYKSKAIAEVKLVKNYYKKPWYQLGKILDADIKQQTGMVNADIDAVLLGYNGHRAYDKIFDTVKAQYPESDMAYFKHLCGEYFTSSSFALWLALEIIQKQQIPTVAQLPGQPQKRQYRNIVITNGYFKDYFTAILVSAC